MHSIRDLNRAFCEELRARLGTWNERSTLGDIFLKFTPLFKMYAQVPAARPAQHLQPV